MKPPHVDSELRLLKSIHLQRPCILLLPSLFTSDGPSRQPNLSQGLSVDIATRKCRWYLIDAHLIHATHTHHRNNCHIRRDVADSKDHASYRTRSTPTYHEPAEIVSPIPGPPLKLPPSPPPRD